MIKNKILKTTIVAGAISTNIAENKNLNIDKNIDWDNFLNKFEEHKKNIFQQCEKSIVEIYGTKKEKINLDGFIFDNDIFFDDFPFSEKEEKQKSRHLDGIKTQEIKTNGFLVSDDGFILTNYSDIKGFENLNVKIGENKYQVISINYDVFSDLALLKIEAINLNFLSFNNSDVFKSSKYLYKLGNNKDCYLNISVEADDQSKKESSSNKKKWFQWGKSSKKKNKDKEKKENKHKCSFKNTSKTNFEGCACVINVRGEIAGVEVKSGKYSNNKVGKFHSVIPSDKILAVLESLKKGEKIKHDLCGIKLIENDEQLSNEKLLKVKKGCYIDSVDESLKNINFKSGDIITHLNNYKTNDLSSLYKVFEFVKNSDLVFTLNRNGEKIDVKVDFGVMSDIKLEINDKEIKTRDFVFSNNENNGLIVKCVNNSMVDLISPFVISEIDHLKIGNLKDLLSLIKERLNKNNENKNSLSFLIDGYFLNNNKERKVFGIKLS